MRSYGHLHHCALVLRLLYRPDLLYLLPHSPHHDVRRVRLVVEAAMDACKAYLAEEVVDVAHSIRLVADIGELPGDSH